MISVIVPVYNVEAYLDRCVESIVGQTYKDLEIILVDDGSKDHSPQMCDEWSRKDARIKVIHKENGGAATARNIGISIAQGKYIGFVDSDDLIHPKMFETLLHVIALNDADIVECGFMKFKSLQEIQINQREDKCNITSMTSVEALEELVLERKIHQIPWNKLYKKSVIGSIRFPAGVICEDEFWTYQIIGNADKIVYIDAILYYYYLSVGSVMRARYSLKRLVCIDAFKRRLDYIAKRFPGLVPLANRSYLGACIFHYQMLCLHSDVDVSGNERRQLYQRYCEGDWRGLVHLATWKYKFWYSLFRHFPNATARLRNAFKIGW